MTRLTRLTHGPTDPAPSHPTGREGLPVATVTRLAADGGGSSARQARLIAVQGALALDLGAGCVAAPETPELDDSRRSRLEQVAEQEVRAWAARFAQAVVEAVGGRRPVSQLVRWTAPDVYRDLERRVLLVRRAGGTGTSGLHPQVRSVHVCRPTADVAEVSVHVRHGARSRAIALRLERRSDRWRCTVLQFS